MPSSKPVSIKDIVITQAIAIFFLVIMPTLFNLVVPLSNLEFRKSDSGVTATVVRYVLVFIPWKTVQIENVASVRVEITAEKQYRDRKGQNHTELATGELAIVSDGPEVIVQAAPELATQIAKQFNEFVASDSVEPLAFSVYASWFLSYIVGGVAAFFAGLYAVGATITIFTFPFKWVLSRRTTQVSR